MLRRPRVNLCSSARVYNRDAAIATTSDSLKWWQICCIFRVAVNPADGLATQGRTWSNAPFARVCSLLSLLPRFPNGPPIRACAVNCVNQMCSCTQRRRHTCALTNEASLYHGSASAGFSEGDLYQNNGSAPSNIDRPSRAAFGSGSRDDALSYVRACQWEAV